MKILMLTQYYPPEIGAAPVRLQAMVRELAARGHDVEVVAALPNHPTGRIFDGYRRRVIMTERRDGAVVRRVWVYAATGSGLGRVLNYLSFALFGTIGMFRAGRPDIVLVESPPLTATIPAIVHRAIRRRPNVLLVADLWPDAAVEYGLLREGFVLRVLRRLERLAYSTSWKVSPVTRGQVRTLTEEKGLAADKIVFLPNGVDVDLFQPANESDAARLADDPILLFAGTVGYAHGLDVLLGAAPIVRNRYPRARFVIVGDGSDRDRLERRVRDESIDGVEFRNPVPVDEVAVLYRECFAGVSTIRPSKLLEDGRPSKIFPIMASGRPIAYSGGGEGARIVDENSIGMTAAAGDAAAFASIIISLLDDPSLADQLGRNGRDLAVAEFSWKHLIDDWLVQLNVGA